MFDAASCEAMRSGYDELTAAEIEIVLGEGDDQTREGDVRGADGARWLPSARPTLSRSTVNALPASGPTYKGLMIGCTGGVRANRLRRSCRTSAYAAQCRSRPSLLPRASSAGLQRLRH